MELSRNGGKIIPESGISSESGMYSSYKKLIAQVIKVLYTENCHSSSCLESFLLVFNF